MIKLSELNDEDFLTVKHVYDNDFSVMTKEEFMESSYYLDYPKEPFPKVTKAIESTAYFDLYDAIKSIDYDEDMYEDWIYDVWNDICSSLDVVKINKTIKEIFTAHPSYWEGEDIEIDILPELVGGEK